MKLYSTSLECSRYRQGSPTLATFLKGPINEGFSCSPFCETYYSFQGEYFQMTLYAYLKLKRFSSYIGIALLTITGGLDMALDLNYSLVKLVQFTIDNSCISAGANRYGARAIGAFLNTSPGAEIA
ncbi:hypothetical protein Tco_0702137 [Tanacetum coccineum]|uniref:Uncharacterized protein n=1 Tax=Tanacetum coccineum TaxID=301880 RepID=A0ABQ4XVS3_9ASTR